jgi:hypothetical protein
MDGVCGGVIAGWRTSPGLILKYPLQLSAHPSLKTRLSLSEPIPDD